MIRRAGKPAELDTYGCDNCGQVVPGQPIQVYFPYSHVCDSLDGASHFDTDKCLRDFQDKIIKKYGNWKSTPDVPEKRVRSSKEWREERTKSTAPTVNPPKARRRRQDSALKNKKRNQHKQGNE